MRRAQTDPSVSSLAREGQTEENQSAFLPANAILGEILIMDTAADHTGHAVLDANARNLAALGYVWILSVPVFWAKRNDAFIGAHARQGLALFLASIGVWFIPYISHIAEIILGICMIMGYFQASHGKTFTLPLVGVQGRAHSIRIGTSVERLIKLLFHPANKDTTREGVQKTGAMTHENEIAACAYLWIGSIIVLERYGQRSSLVASHAKQAIVIFVLSVIFFSLGDAGRIVNLVLFLASVAGFIRALSGKVWRIPLIAVLSENLPSLEMIWCTALAWIHKTLQKRKQNLVEIRNEIMSQRKTIAEGEEGTGEEKTIAPCCYFFLGPLLAVIHRSDAFIRFHAFIGIALNVLFLILYAYAPTRYSSFVIFALMLLGATGASAGKKYPVPLGYEIAQGIQRIMKGFHKDAS